MADYKPNGTTAPKKMTFKERLRKHWWLHLLNFVVGTLLISLLLTYVGLPNIAQHDVNRSELSMEYQIVTNPRPDVIRLKMKNKVRNKSIFTPTLDAFNASLFLENTEPNIKPFGFINIPSVHALKVTYTEVDQDMKIADMEQFIAYNKLVTSSEEFRVAVRGRTRLHLGALPVVWVDFNKAIQMKGLNGLKGIRVTDVNITMQTFSDGSNMHGNVIIPNPSVMTLTIGDMVQDLFADGKAIGNTTIKNVILKPGDNIFPVTSTTDQAAVIPLIGPGHKFPKGELEIEARTREIIYDGQPLPYFTEAMKASPVHFTLDIGPALRAMGLGMIVDGVTSTSAGLPSPTGSSSLSSPSSSLSVS